ncbi:unnamed protein product (macronuclear) [Paramecium tetraurelia]|uniref:Uncharacterized protein n=1 Tax=Paramecium tetraurelia TaxID=5888 RepID=A0DKW6_PARTE|nr:uncharacterized protein GSPATT00018000001 [Paramecium tetraurelia]CAK83683.1 unnamed protein product [Paramecium tetraurelia]|eukprot:XP_001451080.1 hypothetical protein (macronuclear) [Paramecium tetraurelia strain d4-2]
MEMEQRCRDITQCGKYGVDQTKMKTIGIYIQNYRQVHHQKHINRRRIVL